VTSNNAFTVSVLNGSCPHWLVTDFNCSISPEGSQYVTSAWTAYRTLPLTMPSTAALVSAAAETRLLSHDHTMANSDMSQYIGLYYGPIYMKIRILLQLLVKSPTSNPS
jgi:hypothetical protein